MFVINLFGGPGSGKSTTASGLFFEMKLKKIDVELVTEYAKKLTWQKRHNTLKDQFKVTAEQNHRMEILKDQVDFVITDSPIILGMYYSVNYFPDTFPNFVYDVFNSYSNINFFINRIKEYNPKGRNQTFDEAVKADHGIKKILLDYNIPFKCLDGDEKTPSAIIEHIKEMKLI